MTSSEVVAILLLTGALGLFFSFLMMRTEFTGSSRVSFTYGGFPFEAIKIKIAKVGYHHEVTIDEYFWNEIILNVILYMVFSIIIVKLATWILDEIRRARRSARLRG